MKTIRFSSSLFAFLLLLTSVSLTSCGTEELAPDQLAANSIQADLQVGGNPADLDCYCISPCNSFQASHVLLPLIQATQDYDFKVTVYQESECDASALVGKDCKIRGKFTLGVGSSEYPIDMNDFEEYMVVDHLDQPLSYETDPQIAEFITKKAFSVYFKWKQEYNGPLIPAQSAFSSGGLCIIGILNDPNGDDYDPSGEEDGTSSDGGGSNG